MSNRGRVLIVDDEENVAVTLQAVLERDGYEVEAVTTLRDARRLIARRQFEAALVDLRLGDTDSGLDVLSILSHQQPGCMSVILTGFASLESAIGAIKNGAYDYLIKPCDMEELKLTVARAVEHGLIARGLRDHLSEMDASNKELRVLAEDLRTRLEETLADLRERISEATQRLSDLERRR